MIAAERTTITSATARGLALTVGADEADHHQLPFDFGRTEITTTRLGLGLSLGLGAPRRRL